MINEFKKVLFIVNKFSGAGFREALEGAIIDHCKAQTIEATIEFTKARGHATELAIGAKQSGDFDLVVAVGGDGTVNEVATGLLHSNIPMGILPKGSGNGLARHLGIPMKISSAIGALFDSQRIAMDCFTVNGQLSLNVSGIGFDGHVANIFGHGKKRGLRGYTKVTLSEFVRFREFEAEIISGNDTVKRKAFVIAIANSSQYGNNARIAPAASVTDGILHVCLLKKVPAYRLDFVYNFFAGKINESSFSEFIETKHMIIKLDEPVAFHIDGEPSGVGKVFDISILPQSLQMMAPKKSLKF